MFVVLKDRLLIYFGISCSFTLLLLIPNHTSWAINRTRGSPWVTSVVFSEKFFLKHVFTHNSKTWGFPGGSVVKSPPASARRHKRSGFNPWVGRIPWRRRWQPLQYPCLENAMDRGTWGAMAHRVVKSQTRLSIHAPWNSKTTAVGKHTNSSPEQRVLDLLSIKTLRCLHSPLRIRLKLSTVVYKAQLAFPS